MLNPSDKSRMLTPSLYAGGTWKVSTPGRCICMECPNVLADTSRACALTTEWLIERKLEPRRGSQKTLAGQSVRYGHQIPIAGNTKNPGTSSSVNGKMANATSESAFIFLVGTVSLPYRFHAENPRNFIHAGSEFTGTRKVSTEGAGVCVARLTGQ